MYPAVIGSGRSSRMTHVHVRPPEHGGVTRCCRTVPGDLPDDDVLTRDWDEVDCPRWVRPLTRAERTVIENRGLRERKYMEARKLRESGLTWRETAEQMGAGSAGSAYTMAVTAGFQPAPGWVEDKPAFWWTTCIPVHRRGR
jgi:hypothetical protein